MNNSRIGSIIVKFQYWCIKSQVAGIRDMQYFIT